MKKIKCVFFVVSLTLIGVMASAQATDSVKIKSGFFSKVNLSKIQMPKLHLPKVNLFKKDTTVKKDTAVAIQNKKEKTKLVEKPFVDTTAIVKDTLTKKTSWFSKISFSKKNNLNKDSDQVVAPIIEKAKDTTIKKTSWFSKKTKLNNDSTQVKVKEIAKVKEATVAKIKDTTSLYKTVQQKFLQYTATTTVSLLGGANFSKQSVNAGGYNSNFNYSLSDIEEDVYKTGYFGGIRLDGKFKKKHEYSLGFNFSKITAGAKYTSFSSLTPVVGSFSPFKADDHFFVMNIAAHYKKLIPYGDIEKFKFYLIAGPSIDARFSNTSLDNKVTNAYKKIFLKGDLGLEFNNRSLYTLFFHYQHNIGSLTKSPIQTNMNMFQLGIMVKAADLL